MREAPRGPREVRPQALRLTSHLPRAGPGSRAMELLGPRGERTLPRRHGRRRRHARPLLEAMPGVPAAGGRPGSGGAGGGGAGPVATETGCASSMPVRRRARMPRFGTMDSTELSSTSGSARTSSTRPRGFAFRRGSSWTCGCRRRRDAARASLNRRRRGGLARVFRDSVRSPGRGLAREIVRRR